MSYVKLKAKKFWLIISLITLVVILNLSNLIAQNDFKEEDQCIVCHEDNELMPEGFQEYDVHFQKGISCIGCHGGDPTSDDEDIAMSMENGFTGIPANIKKFRASAVSAIHILSTYVTIILVWQLTRNRNTIQVYTERY